MKVDIFKFSLIATMLIFMPACQNSNIQSKSGSADGDEPWEIALLSWISRDLERKSWQGNLDLETYAHELSENENLALAFDSPHEIGVQIEFLDDDYEIQPGLMYVSFKLTITSEDNGFESFMIDGGFCKLSRNRYWKLVYDTSTPGSELLPLADRDNLAQFVAFGMIDNCEREGFEVRYTSSAVLVGDIQREKYFSFASLKEGQLYGDVTLISEKQFMQGLVKKSAQ